MLGSFCPIRSVAGADLADTISLVNVCDEKGDVL